MKTLRELNAQLADAKGNLYDAWKEHSTVVDLWEDSGGTAVTQEDINAFLGLALAAEQTYSAAYQEREEWYGALKITLGSDPLDFDDDEASEDEDDDSLIKDQAELRSGQF